VRRTKIEQACNVSRQRIAFAREAAPQNPMQTGLAGTSGGSADGTSIASLNLPVNEDCGPPEC